MSGDNRQDDERLPLDLWRRLDWRFLLPDPDVGRLLCAGRPDALLVEAAALVAREVRVAPPFPADLTQHYDTALLACASPRDLPTAVRAVRPGGWLCVEVRRGLRPRDTVGGWTAAFQRHGLIDVRAHWHPPSMRERTRMVPLDSRPAVLDTLQRHQAVRFGSVQSRVAAAARVLGLLPYLVPEGTVVGQVPSAVRAIR